MKVTREPAPSTNGASHSARVAPGPNSPRSSVTSRMRVVWLKVEGGIMPPMSVTVLTFRSSKMPSTGRGSPNTAASFSNVTW